VQILTECRWWIFEKQALRPLAEKRVLDTWEKIGKWGQEMGSEEMGSVCKS